MGVFFLLARWVIIESFLLLSRRVRARKFRVQDLRA
jgi:hypothetical protein